MSAFVLVKFGHLDEVLVVKLYTPQLHPNLVSYLVFVQIKFVVDGDWKIDPERETVNRNGVHNNILRVDSVDDPATL